MRPARASDEQSGKLSSIPCRDILQRAMILQLSCMILRAKWMLAPVFRCVQDCDKDKGGRVRPIQLQGPALSTFPGLRTTPRDRLSTGFSTGLGFYTPEVGPFTFPSVESFSSLIPQLAQDYCDTVSIVCCRPVTVAQESSVHNHRCSTQTPLSGFLVLMS